MESTGLRKRRKERELSSLIPTKQKESNYNRSKKGKEPQIDLNEEMGSPIETTTSKNIKEVPESSLGRNQNASSSPVKRTFDVVLAMSADHTEEKKKRQKMHKGVNHLKSDNSEEKKQANSKRKDAHDEKSAIQLDDQKKRRAINGDTSVQHSGISKISSTTEDGVHKVDVDSSSHVQDQDDHINKSIGSGDITDKNHKEMSVLELEITRNKRSKRREKHTMENGWNKFSNYASVRNLMEKKVDSDDDKIILDTVCGVNKQEVMPSKTLEAASKLADEHEETFEALSDCLPLNRVLREIKTKKSAEQRDKRILEREMKKLSNTHSDPNQENSGQLDGKASISSPITASKINQKELKKKAGQACKDLVGASEATVKEEVGMTHSKKRSKERAGQKNKNLLDSICISANTITKFLKPGSSFPENSEHSLASSISSMEALSDDKLTVLQSLHPSNCENDTQTHIPDVCNETESPRGLKTYRRKDKNIFPWAKNSESSILKDQLEVSTNSLITSVKEGEINSKNKNELNISPNVQHPPHNKIPEEDKSGQALNISPGANIVLEHNQENDSATCSNQLRQENVAYSRKSFEACPNKIFASKKTHRRDKMSSTSDPSPECPNSSSHEETTTSSLNECQMEAIAPSVESVSKDAVMVGNEIIKDVIQKRSASPAIIHTTQLRRKLLILDLNGLVVDIVSSLPEGCKADTWIARKALIKRPFCDDFLKFCFETFDVGVWSSRTRRNVDSVLDFIMGDMRHKLIFCWDQYHCTDTGFSTVEEQHKPMLLKELRKVWRKFGEYNESNTVLLDDSPYKALINPPHTAIFPCSYEFTQKDDNALGPGGNIRKYLENLAAAPHVQKFIEENPFVHPFGQRAVTKRNTSWGYYLRVIHANAFRLPA